MTREIVIVSGKGGTGKTSISSSLIYLFNRDKFSVLGVDADIEAPDLALALGGGNILSEEEVWESHYAFIKEEECVRCNLCLDACQFGAIELNESGYPYVIPELCEGCNACKIVCPVEAIELKKRRTGKIIHYKTRFSDIVTGKLEIGMRNSGLMVDLIRDKARRIAANKDSDLILIDGAPGIGCSVISSVKGAYYAIIVMEPTATSLRSGKRVYEVIKHFNVPAGLIVNKFDLKPEFVSKIKEWAESEGLEFLGGVPFDKSVVESYVNMKPLLEFDPSSHASKSITEIYEKIKEKVLR